MNFKIRILASFEFLGVSNLQQTADKVVIYFVCIFNYNRNGKVEIMIFSKQLLHRSQKNSRPTKIN